MSIDINKLFAEYLPNEAKKYDLKPFQKQVIEHLCDKGSTVAVMQTGGGKSLIYWLAARVLDGVCIVISPLIALIDEQAEKIREHGYEVMVCHGGIPTNKQTEDLKKFARNGYTPQYIFVSPERIATDGFFEFCIKQRKDVIKLLTIDEIHCVSQWGFDFRPFYKRIPVFLNSVFDNNWPIIIGLTATINPKELRDICEDFKIPNSSILKDEILLRFDIDLKVENYFTEDEKEERLWELLNNLNNEKALIYLYRKYNKHGVEDLCKKANDKGYHSDFFHGDMTSEERQTLIAKFKNEETNIIFATNAFGMGIDIPDIRLIIHFMLPESIEQYYQEIGRGGRDRLGTKAYILYSNKNIQVRKTHFIDKSYPKQEELIELFKKIANNEIGIKTLQYFADEEIQSVLPYYINCGALSIEAKGFVKLNIFEKTTNQEISRIINLTKTGGAITTLKKTEFTNLSIQDFFDKFYSGILNDEIRFSKSIDKCLIIRSFEEYLTNIQIEEIENEVNYKKEYKHNLLDYLVYILSNYEDSVKLHQEIGRYLGVPKHSLNKIYTTESNDIVRSKSEVIIANILYRSGIQFKYEEKLYYNDSQWIEPDFTIDYNGVKYYWEHLGMLGDEEYDSYWAWKKKLYKSLNIDNLITTQESCVLSDIVNHKIKIFFD